MPPIVRPRRGCAIAAAALAAASLLLTGCSASASSTDSETPPADTLNPSTASQEQLDAEAQRVFRLYFEEYVKLETAGGADQLPPAWRDYVTGEAYESFDQLFRDAKAEGLHWAPGEVTRLAALAPAPPDTGAPGAVAVLQSCDDSTGNTLYDQSGQVVGHGTLAVRTSSFQWTDQSLKIYHSVVGGADSCPLS